MVVLDFTRVICTESVELSSVPDLDPRARALAIETWRGRMVNEHISAQVFAGLVPQAMRAGMPPETQAELASMISDELRHARQCAAVVSTLGGAPIADAPELRVLPEHPETTRRVAFLRNLLSVSCLSETMAVSLLEAERRDLEEEGSAAAHVLKRILADEVTHARFGWRSLESWVPGLDEEERGLLSAYLPTALQYLVAHELDHLAPAPPPTRAAAHAGVCDGANARLLVFETIEDVIVPGLEGLGLEARAAWTEVGARLGRDAQVEARAKVERVSVA